MDTNFANPTGFQPLRNESNLFAGLLPSSMAFHGGYPTRNAVSGGSDQLQFSLAFHGTGYLAGNAVSGSSDQFTPSMAICDVGYIAGNSVSNGCELFDYGFFCPPHADFPPWMNDIQLGRITATTALPNQVVGDAVEANDGNDGRITTTVGPNQVVSDAAEANDGRTSS